MKKKFFELSFRVFFIIASFFSIISIGSWMLVYVFNFSLELKKITSFEWHAHEMIYGYSMAVISGFLLTAISNWNGIKRFKNKALITSLVLWGATRVLFLFGDSFLKICFFLDTSFILLILVLVSIPVLKLRDYRQLIITTKVLLLLIFNSIFYLGAFNLVTDGTRIGIYGGLYSIIGLILIFGQRVIPGFIKNGLSCNLEVKSYKTLTVLTSIFFLFFSVNELFIKNRLILFLTSTTLFLLISFKLIVWHRVKLWQKPLIYGLYLSFISINFGFLLYSLSLFFPIPKLLALHCFSFGGIALATLSMMSRVNLRQAGRSVRDPGVLVHIFIGLVFLGVIFRTVFPLIISRYYLAWIFISQLLWIIAFSLFLVSNRKMFLAGVEH